LARNGNYSFCHSLGADWPFWWFQPGNWVGRGSKHTLDWESSAAWR
jgi:hypothetical protein